MIVNLKNATSGMVKQAPVGFSWTTLFFGAFPALFRGDIKWFFIQWLLAVVTFGISWIVFPFIYNGIYIKGRLESGFVPADETSKGILQGRGFVFNQ